jgi:hypothetical protein
MSDADTTDHVLIPITDASLGGWIVKLYPDWPTDDGEGKADMVDVGWSKDGTREHYRNCGDFRSMRETMIALEAIGRRLSSKDATTSKEILEAAGFTRPPVQGFSVPGMPYWQKDLDDRWFVYFIHDELNGIELKVVDRSVVPHRYRVLGSIRFPTEMRYLVPMQTPAIDEGLLAILNARIAAGDPAGPLV